jgi:hypothetical protein
MADLPVAKSALTKHAIAVWQYLYDNSEATVTESGEPTRVWTGFITAAFPEAGAPTTYYSQVMRLLKASDCVHQLQRGGNNTPSEWAILREPTEEAFAALPDKSRKVHGKVGKIAAVEQQVRDMRARIDTLEHRVMELETEVRVLKYDAKANDDNVRASEEVSEVLDAWSREVPDPSTER